MATLTIDCGKKDGATEFMVGYRLYNSGSNFTFITPNPTTLPVTVQNVPNGQYETSVSKKCNGVFSDPVVAASTSCAEPISFAASRVNNTFLIAWLLTIGQSIFDLETTDPNGGIQTNRYTLGNSGSASVDIAPFIEGSWRLRLRGICDPNATNLMSAWTGYISITVANIVACAQVTNGVITNVTSTTVSVSATAPVSSASIAGYTLQLVINGGSNTTSAASTPSWDVNNLTPSTTYSVYIITNCANGGISTPYYVGQFTTGNVPSISLFGESDTGVGGTATQDFIIGTSIQLNNKFTLTVYSHSVVVSAAANDTPTTIAVKLRDAINNTSAAQWNDAGSAPVSGTNGFKPTATYNVDFQGAHIIVTLDHQHRFAASATFN